MAVKPYWWMTRPHRKLIRVPKSLAAFAGVAAGQVWSGNRDLQIAFENRLEDIEVKRRGEHSERARGRGGSGGRTHAALLYSLGLYFYHRDDAKSPEEVHLTLAGQALIDQEDALPVLRKQVLAYQFPSAFSVASGVDVDRKFRLRPFIALLKILRDPLSKGYLTDREIAACVIGDMTSHSQRAVEEAIERILRFRIEGASGLPDDFAERMRPKTSRSDMSANELIQAGKPLGDIANTAAQWIRYTGFAMPAAGVEFGVDEPTVTALNPNLLDEIDSAIELWGKKPLLTVPEPTGSAFDASEAAKAFQRSYGVKFGKLKDQRTIRDIKGRSESDRTVGLISASLSHLYSTKIVREPTEEVVSQVVSHSGIDRSTVEDALRKLISTPQVGMSAFLDRYEQMAFAGTDEALNFEKATESLMKDTFGLNARHIGQLGTVPDLEIWTDSWGGIIDTKAYSAYDLPHDHQLRMHADYIPDYSGAVQGRKLEFFLYLAGGFADSFNAKLRNVMDKSGIPGAGISMRALLHLVEAYDGHLHHDDFKKLWSIGREITVQDIANLTRRELDGSTGEFSPKEAEHAELMSTEGRRPNSETEEVRSAVPTPTAGAEVSQDPAEGPPVRATRARRRRPRTS